MKSLQRKSPVHTSFMVIVLVMLVWIQAGESFCLIGNSVGSVRSLWYDIAISCHTSKHCKSSAVCVYHLLLLTSVNGLYIYEVFFVWR